MTSDPKSYITLVKVLFAVIALSFGMVLCDVLMEPCLECVVFRVLAFELVVFQLVARSREFKVRVFGRNMSLVWLYASCAACIATMVAHVLQQWFR